MKIDKGCLKIIHNFPYERDFSAEEKLRIIEETLIDIKEKGYDGVVINAEFSDGYIENEENMSLVRKKVEIARKLGMRVWIYDEKYYPSGAADTITLRDNPELEALAIACVSRVLEPNEECLIPIPRGHLKPMGAFGYSFTGECIGDENLTSATVFPWCEDGYLLKNEAKSSMLCLAFFTKHAFEGTHCQHNAATIRRYIDIGNEKSGKAFVENTYRPYCDLLDDYIKDGTVEAFFTDEPSYMACYFNLNKKPPEVSHPQDDSIPLYAMLHWSCDLEKHFYQRYGYDLMQKLPQLFIGGTDECKKTRRDYYSLLTDLASRGFFKPVSDFCQERGTSFSGHILLEEKITDHLKYEGNFFKLLKNMHIPGMDMLDSIPERVWKKAFTPLLVSSISKLYRQGDVLNEVSCYFQNKFSVPVSPTHILTSLVLQYALGATLFASYYDDERDAIHNPLPCGRSVLSVFHSVMAETGTPITPKVLIHYPIESIMENTVSAVDVARVYDSVLNEYLLPYPIDRADLAKNLSPKSVVEDNCYLVARRTEGAMESAMFSLLDNQIPFLFSDTSSLDRAQMLQPKLVIIPPQRPTRELISKIKSLGENGAMVAVMLNEDTCQDEYSACSGVKFIKTTEELQNLFIELSLVFVEGDRFGVVSMWTDDGILVVNSENVEKTLSYMISASEVKEYLSGRFLPICSNDSLITFTLPPYGVAIIK